MGLGKTIQVLSLLLTLKRGRAASKTADGAVPSLLIVPASLIANWKAEIQKFAPSLSVFYAHPSETASEELAAAAKTPASALADHDLVITSYSMAVRLAWLKETSWNVVILDEAQAIKNAGARQSRAVKELRGRHRIALSGTPIENRLSDLWSLFDFLCPGLLGGAKEFAAFLKSRAAGRPEPVRPVAPIGAALHFAPPENGQAHHQRFAGQNRDDRLLPADPPPGRALSAIGQ